MSGSAERTEPDTVRWVESPPHVDNDRMRHISDQHLLCSLDLSRPGFEAVAAAGDDTALALRRWRAYRAGGTAPLPVGDLGRWARRRAARPSAPAMDATVCSADALLSEPVDFLDSSLGRSSFYGFHYLSWMMPLLEAYALTGRARYAERYGALFGQWYAARDDVVGDWPGLDVIWYSLGVWSRSGLFTRAISLLSAEPAFGDEQWQQTMKCLLGGARWAVEEHASFRHGNWQLASVSEAAHVAAVYPEFAEHPAWRDLARQRIDDHLELDFYPDGCHYERAPTYHAMCLHALQVAALSADPEQWPLREDRRLKAAYAWLAGMVHPAGWVPHLQDSHIVRPAETLLVGHHMFGDPEWKWMAKRWLDPGRIIDRLDRLGSRPDGADPVDFFESSPEAEPPRTSRLFGPSGYAVLRQGWSCDDLTAVVNVGPYIGHELEPHSHHACLDFVLSGWGEVLAWEAGGPPTYDDPGYYTWFQHSRGHNSVTLDGEPKSLERNAVAESFHTMGEQSSGLDVVVGRHDAFAQRHRRHTVLIRSDPAYVLVVDDLGGARISSTWTLHSPAPWRTEKPRRYVSDSAPGLVVVPAEPPAEASYDSGPARVPWCQAALPDDDPDGSELRERRRQTDEYRTIFGLHLSAERGTVRTVIVPFRHHAPEVVVEPAHAVDGADGALSVRMANVRDLVGPGRWIRVHAGGWTECARWDLDPEQPDVPPGDDSPWIAGIGLVAWWCRADDDGVVANLSTDRRSTVTLHSPATGALTVNDVGVSPGVDTGDTPRNVTLPSAGQWLVRVAMAAGDE